MGSTTVYHPPQNPNFRRDPYPQPPSPNHSLPRVPSPLVPSSCATLFLASSPKTLDLRSKSDYGTPICNAHSPRLWRGVVIEYNFVSATGKYRTLSVNDRHPTGVILTPLLEGPLNRRHDDLLSSTLDNRDGYPTPLPTPPVLSKRRHGLITNKVFSDTQDTNTRFSGHFVSTKYPLPSSRLGPTDSVVDSEVSI